MLGVNQTYNPSKIMKLNYIATFAAASILTIAGAATFPSTSFAGTLEGNVSTIVADNPCAANPCAGKENPCAATNPCAGKENPCAAANPCAGEENPCAAANPCAGKENPCAANPCAGK